MTNDAQPGETREAWWLPADITGEPRRVLATKMVVLPDAPDFAQYWIATVRDTGSALKVTGEFGKTFFETDSAAWLAYIQRFRDLANKKHAEWMSACADVSRAYQRHWQYVEKKGGSQYE